MKVLFILIQKGVKKMIETGIITFHCADNVGAVLQVYALQQALRKLNVESEIIDFRPEFLIIPYDDKIYWINSIKKIGLLRTIKRNIIKFLHIPSIRKRISAFNNFRDKNLIISKSLYLTEEELKTNPPVYKYYISGSDQVWNPNFFTQTGDPYFLDFAPENSIKISYAASIADKVAPDLNDRFKNNIGRFNHISIREKEHLDILKELTNKSIIITLDPTLLLEKSDFANVLIEPEIEYKYILVYDLQINEELIKLANKISREKGYKVISFSDFCNYDEWIKSFQYEGPGEFLGYVEKAELVLSTSFHGVAFSIIYNKSFYTIPHTARGSRMIELLTSIGLDDRIIYKADELKNIGYEIDYKNSLKMLQIRKTESINFLINALDIEN